MKKYLFVLALVMISLPFALRFAHGNPAVPGIEQYYHLVSGSEVSFWQGARFVWEPYSVLSSLVFSLFGSVMFLPAVLAFLSFVAFVFLLRKIVSDQGVRMWVLLVLILSPTFLSVAFLGSRAVLALLFILLGCLSLFRFRWLSFVFFALVGFSGVFASVAGAVFLVALSVLFPDLKRPCLLNLALLAVITVLFPAPPSLSAAGVSGVFHELGGRFGTGVFILLLAVIGAAVLWSNKREYYALFALFLCFLVACFYYGELVVYANLLLCGLAGVALSWLSDRRWTLQFLRSASLLVLFCGLLFSSVSNIVSLADSPPHPEFFEVLDAPSGVVLTHQDYGFWVQFAGHLAVADPFVSYLPDSQSRLRDLDYVFHTNDLGDAKDILAHYGVSYVMLTGEMSEGLVWDRESRGLAFLVNNAETFKRLNLTDSVSLWQVKR